MPAKLLEIQIVNDDGFDIRIAFGSHRVAGELDVGRRKNSRLGVMDVGVFDKRQIARAAGDRHVQVVLDTPGLGAMPNPQVAVPGIGIERHKDDLRSLLRGDSSQFGKLDVVADLNRDATAIGVEHLDSVAGLTPHHFRSLGVMWILYCLPIEPSRRNRYDDVVKRVVFDHEL